MEAERLIDDTLLAMGMNPALCPDYPPEGCTGESLRHRLRSNLESAAAKAVLSTPREELTGWKRWPDITAVPDEEGGVVLTLPSDFLLLHSLRLRGWERSVREILPADSWLRHLQSCRWSGLRGTPRRPLAFATLDDEGHRGIHLFSVPKNSEAQLLSGWYMPRPAMTSAGDIDIPPAAIERCISLLIQTADT